MGEPMVRAWLHLAIVTWLVVAAFSVANAQSTNNHNEARALFEQGLQSVNDETFSDAVSKFRRSLRLVPRVSTALNLALAQRSLGEMLQVRETLKNLLVKRYGRVDARTRAAAHSELKIIRRELGKFVLRVSGGNDIEVDGESTATFPIQVKRRSQSTLACMY